MKRGKKMGDQNLRSRTKGNRMKLLFSGRRNAWNWQLCPSHDIKYSLLKYNYR